MDKALITGGTGFIGRHLCASLLDDGWSVEVVTRDTAAAADVLPTGATPVAALKMAQPADVVINLAGENLADGRWTEARKREMRESRLRVTRELTDVMGEWPSPPEVLISGSAVGYYGARGDDVDLFFARIHQVEFQVGPADRQRQAREAAARAHVDDARAFW